MTTQRIALLVHGWPPHNATGVEVHAQALAHAWVAQGATVEVLHAHMLPGTQEDAGAANVHGTVVRTHEGALGVSRLSLRRAATADEALEAPGVETAVAAWLDAVQPTVVWCEHSIHLGLGALKAAAARGVPVIHRAHDHWLVSPQYLSVRPDLQPMVPNDSGALARIDLLRERHPQLAPGLGGTIAPELATAEHLQALSTMLDGDADALHASGIDGATFRSAVEARRALERRRREAVRGVDLVLAPTHTLAAVLRNAGLPCPVEVLPCGIEERGLEAVPAAPTTPLSLGFVGTLAPHKGLDVLLAALEGQSGFALRVFGTTDDPQRLHEVRTRIERVGGELIGAYEPSAIAEAFSRFAVLVMPSRWPEVAPFVLLEARAARRAIVASAVGGVSELVVDGREALLVPPSDALALRAALLRLRDEPDLVTQMASRCVAPASIQHEAGACLELMARMQAERAQASSALTLPATVNAVGARIAKLDSLSNDDLAARAVESLAKARKQLLGTERAPLAIVQTALARVQHERARTAELQHLLEHSTAAVSSELEALRTELAWRAGTEAALRAELAWRASTEAALRAELAWRASTEAALRAELAAVHAEARWRAETAQHALQAEREQAQQASQALAAVQAELELLRSQVVEHAQTSLHLVQATQAVTALQAEVEWRRGRETARDEALQHAQARSADLERSVQAERQAHHTTREHLQRAKEALANLQVEVEWRTAEMEAVRESLSRVRFAFVGRNLRQWVLRWPQAGEHA